MNPRHPNDSLVMDLNWSSEEMLAAFFSNREFALLWFDLITQQRCQLDPEVKSRIIDALETYMGMLSALLAGSRVLVEEAAQ